MKSVITILIDSVYSKRIGNYLTKESSTPFIDELSKEGLFAPNIYSFGPYTDAATKGLYCGQPTLDDFGFYYCINGSETNHFKAFKTRGYETYGFYYPYYLLSKKTEQYIDHSIYISGFLYESVWNGKLKYYSELREKGEITDFDYQILEKCLDMVFESWIQFYKNIEYQEYSDLIVSRLYNPDNKETQGAAALYREFEFYKNNKKEYINSVLTDGMNHKLAKINDYDFDRHLNISMLKNELYVKHKDFFDDIYKKNKSFNRKNNHFNYRRFFKDGLRFVKTREKEDLRYEINYALLMSSTKMMQKRSLQNEWQLEASAGKQIDTLIELLEKRHSEKPFYASLHVEEPHHNIAFFSYDSDDLSRIEEEISYLKPLVDGCGEHFSGNLMYQLSLRYVDFCIKRLMAFLRKAHLLDDVVILLVADHGSSYTFSPLRDSVTNNYYDENYHIPMIIWDKDISIKSNGTFNGLYNSSDVFPTLFDVVGLESDKNFKGESVLSHPRGRDIVISEYTGPGCPDLMRRDIWITGRTRRYSVSYRVSLDSEIEKAVPIEIYDRCSDPYEKNNIATIIDINDTEIRFIDMNVKSRLREIKNSRDEIVRHFDSFKITLDL